ncbi:beta-1,3-glucanase family protein [Hymenobacter sp. DH14]|uniref:Beta-1,3-glucanase family protein n=1 Tax=Hymenobacter cyanobacteriorum TaxID=2926463 RepID=A0A9X1VD82_9BACT|nr:beta-1,3-glucanase family protein [Hymenobacter cyanobacteriorum]MCI1186751.1 beta-1,3-glucanase family protein [Hymenobacter cyanobacteriorum]
MKKLTLLAFLVLLTGVLLPRHSHAQGSIPFTINNTSPFADTDLYVAIVGIDPSNNHVWINAANGQVLPMSSSYNTVTGPTINGNTGPGQNSKYAACFTKLSAIPNRTFTLPYIAGCRVYISRGQQLYFYFFGANGAPSGYTAPNPQSPTDPNTGILYETIELANNSGGFFGNTTRVDAFAYPMGLELYGNGYYKKTGELKTASEIVAAYKANVPTEFQGTVNNSTGVISFPSKTPAFYDGTNGTTAGPYGNYFKSYIDAIWNKYKSVDLIFYAGNAGVFKGRVDANDRLTVVGQSGAFTGRTGIISRRPTTQEAFEGKGVLATGVSDVTVDLVVQAQMTAAINRHIVNTTAATPGQQNWYDVASFYGAAPMNYYARFWHLPGISVDNLSYGFAYDDVADQSATLQTPQPTKVVATFGGFAGQGATAQAIPGKIEGESFSAQSGTQTETTTDTGGGLNVDYFETNDWLDYSVNVATAGSYTVGFRVASANGGATLQLRNSGGGVLGSVNVGNTGGWQNWQTINATVTLPAGKQTLRVFASASTGCNLNWLNFASATAAFSRQLEAEAANVNNGMTVETCSEGGQDMGYIDPADYLVWNGINFPTTGTYLIEYRVASGASGGTISADLNAGSIQFGNTTIPGTGGWQNWTTVSKTVTINAGTYNFGIYAQTGGYNLNWVRITKQGANRALATTGAAETALALYPNPVRDRLTLDAGPEFAGSQLSILSIDGRTVWRGTYRGETVDVSALRPGLYTLLAQTTDGRKVLSRFSKE